MSDAWLYDEHPAMFRAHPFLFILLLISVVGLLAIGVWWLRTKGERLALSDREVLMERGLLAKQRTEIALSSIRSVRITQSFGQRIFDVGNVELFSDLRLRAKKAVDRWIGKHDQELVLFVAHGGISIEELIVPFVRVSYKP